jgi:hypothetical protein
MLIAEYDIENAYDEHIEDYNEEKDIWNMEDFKESVIHHLSNKTFPLQLIALNSNWRKQTGYATIDSVEELLQKVISFDSNYYELHKIRNSYEFRLASHDVPCGLTIQIRSIK